MDKAQFWIAVISLLTAIFFGTITILTSIIVATVKIMHKFSAIESRLTGVEAVTLAQNHRLEMIETKGTFVPSPAYSPRRKRRA